MQMQAHDKGTGAQVSINDTVTDSRGTGARLVRLERINMEGHDGRVAVMWPEDRTSRSYPAGVFNLLVTRVRTVASRCDANARRGTGTGTCDRPLDSHGQCDRASDHL